MAHLIQEQEKARAANEAQAFNFYLKEQQSFLDKHVLRWLNQFTADLIEHAATDYYQGIAKLSQGFILGDHQLLREYLS